MISITENSYLSWNQRQYVFQGAEILLDEEDEDEENEDEDSSGSDSDDESISSAEIRENETDVTSTPKSNTRIILHSDSLSGEGVNTEAKILKKCVNVQSQSGDKSN